MANQELSRTTGTNLSHQAPNPYLNYGIEITGIEPLMRVDTVTLKGRFGRPRTELIHLEDNGAKLWRVDASIDYPNGLGIPFSMRVKMPRQYGAAAPKEEAVLTALYDQTNQPLQQVLTNPDMIRTQYLQGEFTPTFTLTANPDNQPGTQQRELPTTQQQGLTSGRQPLSPGSQTNNGPAPRREITNG